MKRLGSLTFGIILLTQACVCGSHAEGDGCQSGFSADRFTFRVDRRHLHTHLALGKVRVSGCGWGKAAVFNSSDSRFEVERDGTVRTMTALILHNSQQSFSVFASGSKDRVSARVTLQYDPTLHPHRQGDVIPAVPVLGFPWLSRGLNRRKRGWIIPEINFSENKRGEYPHELVQIRSSYHDADRIFYSISGPGADEPPVGIFKIQRFSGMLSVTEMLDREKIAKYKLMARAERVAAGSVEDPMEIIINIIDQNDNKPQFTQDHFVGKVPEASPAGFEFMKVTATDADEPGSANAEIRYSIIDQDPPLPNINLFFINPVNGGIQVASAKLDRETFPEYKLTIQAADDEGNGLISTCTVAVIVLDSNDHAPRFQTSTQYTASVPENTEGFEVLRMSVTDEDEAHSPNWATRYTITKGNEGGFFTISTGANKVEGIITTAKALDFEQNRQFTLLVMVENEVPFVVPLPTSTATVIVNVEDLNEAPIFTPEEKRISLSEDLPVDNELPSYTATDPDIAMNQNISYKLGSDPGGWLSVDKFSGIITVKSPMDRESPFMVDGRYKALIYAIDHDVAPDSVHLPATGTGTLLIELEDVNDNAPSIDQREISLCNQNPQPALLSISDADGPGLSFPFRVDLQRPLQKHWSAKMNDTKTGIILTMKTMLTKGDYDIILRVYDNEGYHQDNTLKAQVCDCSGNDLNCSDVRVLPFGLPGILGILGAILFLLLLLLLLLVLIRRKRGVEKEVLLQEEEARDSIYYYNEEGGGEEDQEFDLSQLHRGLDNRPEVYRDDVVPAFTLAPVYRPRPTNPDDIGSFIDENLCAADSDPTAPPYDSLLVFDYEGVGSEAGSLSSLQSCSSGGDQDYQHLNDWGPRFRKLADMYGGGED